MKIFAGNSNITLANKIAKELGLKLSLLEMHTFPDLEKRIRVVDPVVDEDTVVVQPTSTPAEQNFMELFFIIDALKRSGAKSVTVVMPYLGYQRQDHVFRDGEAVSLEVVIRAMEAVGATKFIGFDFHSIKIPEMFKIPVVHLSGLSLFAEQIKKEGLENDNAILTTPDMGGIRRIKILSEYLDNMPYACIEKDRDLVTGSVEAKEISLPEGMTSLKGRNAVIVDDMISSGGTIVKAVNLLKEKGVKKMYVFATHPVFSQNAPTILQDADIEKVFVTDTVLVTADKKFPKLEILSIAKMVADNLK